METEELALSLIIWKIGKAAVARMAMMTITTSNSISVKADWWERRESGVVIVRKVSKFFVARQELKRE